MRKNAATYGGVAAFVILMKRLLPLVERSEGFLEGCHLGFLEFCFWHALFPWLVEELESHNAFVGRYDVSIRILPVDIDFTFAGIIHEGVSEGAVGISDETLDAAIRIKLQQFPAVEVFLEVFLGRAGREDSGHSCFDPLVEKWSILCLQSQTPVRGCIATIRDSSFMCVISVILTCGVFNSEVDSVGHPASVFCGPTLRIFLSNEPAVWRRWRGIHTEASAGDFHRPDDLFAIRRWSRADFSEHCCLSSEIDENRLVGSLRDYLGLRHSRRELMRDEKGDDVKNFSVHSGV